jgi:hypothetical protein
MKKSHVFFLTVWLVVPLTWGAGCKDSARQFGELRALAGDKTDKGIFGHGFTEVYERFFYPLKYEPIRICEIGRDEIRYLNQNIEYAVLFAKNSRQHSMTCIFRKVKREPGPSSPLRSFR